MGFAEFPRLTSVELPWIHSDKMLPLDPGGLYIVVSLGQWVWSTGEGWESADDEKLAQPIISLVRGQCIKNFPESYPYWMPIIQMPAIFFDDEGIQERPTIEDNKLYWRWVKEQVGILNWNDIIYRRCEV